MEKSDMTRENYLLLYSILIVDEENSPSSVESRSWVQLLFQIRPIHSYPKNHMFLPIHNYPKNYTYCQLSFALFFKQIDRFLIRVHVRKKMNYHLFSFSALSSLLLLQFTKWSHVALHTCSEFKRGEARSSSFKT